MLHQPRIGAGADAPQEDQVRIILIGDDFEVVAGLKLPLGAARLRCDRLTALSRACRHEV
jgi:hypothetical protein